MMTRVITKVNNKTIRIPVDRRLVKFIGKEYLAGNIVVLEYDGRWHIRSQRVPGESVIDGMSRSASYQVRISSRRSLMRYNNFLYEYSLLDSGLGRAFIS